MKEIDIVNFERNVKNIKLSKKQLMGTLIKKIANIAHLGSNLK